MLAVYLRKRTAIYSGHAMGRARASTVGIVSDPGRKTHSMVVRTQHPGTRQSNESASIQYKYEAQAALS